MRRQDAISALVSHRFGVMFAVQDGKWSEVARFEYREHLRQARCIRCNTNLIGPKQVYNRNRRGANEPYYIDDPSGIVENRGVQRFKRERGRLVNPLVVEVVCTDCARA